MSKAKKGGKADAKKKPDDEPEFKGPNIYKELLTKQVPELEMDLNAPISVILNENVEFEILVDRINAQCMRLTEDNHRLDKISTKVGAQMETAVHVKDAGVTKAVRERNEISKQNETLKEEYVESQQIKTQMQQDLGKL